MYFECIKDKSVADLSQLQRVQQDPLSSIVELRISYMLRGNLARKPQQYRQQIVKQKSEQSSRNGEHGPLLHPLNLTS
jgi:hypothetical protein